jgi:hypothetical protein
MAAAYGLDTLSAVKCEVRIAQELRLPKTFSDITENDLKLTFTINLGGQGKTGHLSTLQNRPFPVSGIEAE